MKEMDSGQLLFGVGTFIIGLGFEAAPRLPRCSRAGLPLLPPPLPLPNLKDRVVTVCVGEGRGTAPAALQG